MQYSGQTFSFSLLFQFLYSDQLTLLDWLSEETSCDFCFSSSYKDVENQSKNTCSETCLTRLVEGDNFCVEIDLHVRWITRVKNREKTLSKFSCE